MILKNLKEFRLENKQDAGFLLLSPEDSRFDIFFLSAVNEEEGRKLYQRVTELLPNTKFTI
jgi:hypothetical protein